MTRSQLFSIWIGFVVLEVFAFVNAYLVNLKGGTIDAVRFQMAAMDWAKNGSWEFAINSEFFIQYLGSIYRLFGISEFVATQFGIFFMIAAVFVLVKMARHLGFMFPALAVLLFLLWPSMLLRVTTTLREPYIIFFVILAFYASLRFAQTQRFGFAFLCFASLLAGALFHKALAVLVPILGLFIIWKIITGRSARNKLFSIPFCIVSLAFGVVLLGNLSNQELSIMGLKPLQSLILWDTEHISRVLEYKTGRNFRTTYDAAIDFSNLFQFVASLIKSFVYYMFMPFPWLVRTHLDVLALFESLFRFGGLALMIRFIFFGSNVAIGFRQICFLALGLCLIWAAGTANYGTASRHHLTTNWVFLLIYIACLTPRRSVRAAAVPA